MKIRYNIEQRYFDLFNEAQGIATSKSAIMKDPYKIILPYTKYCLKMVKYILILAVISFIFYFIDKSSIFTKLLLYILAFALGLITIMIVIFIAGYLDAKKRKHSGEIQFNKSGILDVSDDGIKMGLPWTYVDFVVVTDSIICILTKAPFFYFLDTTIKDEILEALIKYAPNLKIINQSTTKIEIEENNNVKEESNEEDKIEEEKK